MLEVMTWSHRCAKCQRLTGVTLRAAAGFAEAHCEVCDQQHGREALVELVAQLDAWIEAGAPEDGTTAWFARCAWAAKLIRPTPVKPKVTGGERSWDGEPY